MSAQVTHQRTDVPSDSGDAELIQPSDFTAAHVVKGVREMSPGSAITITGLLADRALIAVPPEDAAVWFTGVAVRIVASLPDGPYRVRIWHEADWTMARLTPEEGVLETRDVVHQQAIWASLLVVDGDVEYRYQPWAALTGVAADKATSGGGSLWVVDVSGTTGASAPDWDNPVDDAVSDGSVVWRLAGDAPASGSFVPYVVTWTEPA